VDTWGAVQRLRVPLLIVRGASSDMLIDRSWARLRRMLPHASLVELPGGHMVPMEQPAAVAAAILAWAEGL
jgi:pimeloyl-ACP methyl ester carboxylesterase